MSYLIVAGALFLAGGPISEMEEGLISSQPIAIRETASLDHWLEDFSAAKAQAEKENKPLLIAFLGPNWCEPSDELETDVLTSASFLEKVEKEVVLFKVDDSHSNTEGKD